MAKALWPSLAGTLCGVTCALAQTTILFETQFERSEGYDPAKDLAGQRSWLMEGTGGNGLLEETFTGLGQQAYIGFLPPTDTNSFTSVWRPVDFDPAAANHPLVRFSVKFQIVSSTKGSDDDFRWSVYNKDGDRLFSIDFETSTGAVSFVPQDGSFKPTGSSISFDGIYDLDVWMDFKRNFYSAYLNDYLLINSETITQKNSPLTFGDADAVWFVRAADPKQAGDNYMAFDNYRISAEALSSIPGYVEAPVVKTSGLFNFRAFGEKGLKYAVEVTQDFVTWHSLGEYTINSAGAFDFEDDTSKGFKQGFYRLRQVP